MTQGAAPGDHELCRDLAEEAARRLGKLQLDLRSTGVSHRHVELEGDRTSHEWLSGELAEQRPDDAVLSEEGADDRRRLQRGRTWIVDPLDGSSGFGWGSPEWAVHVALAVDGVAVAGAVAAPGVGPVLWTGSPRLVGELDNHRPIVVTGWTRARVDGALVARALGGDQASCSSAGVKAALVINRQADVYVHASPLFEWDVCAPAVVAQAAGFDVIDPRGEPLRFNTESGVVPGLVISHPDLTDHVVEALGAARPTS